MELTTGRSGFHETTAVSSLFLKVIRTRRCRTITLGVWVDIAVCYLRVRIHDSTDFNHPEEHSDLPGVRGEAPESRRLTFLSPCFLVMGHLPS